MKNWISLLFIGAVFTPCASSALAADGDAGQVGATLRMGQGARGLAMGSAFSAVSDDASAVYFNPAGLAQLRTTSVDFAWRVMPLLDRKQGYFDAAFPLREDATLALSWIYSGVSGIQERDASGAVGDEFSFSDNLVSATFARVFGKILAVGGSVHYVHQSLFGVSANSAGFSAGMHARFDRTQRRPFPDALQRLTVAAAVQHIGMSLRFNSSDYYGSTAGASTTEKYPIVGRLAASYRLLKEKTLLLSVEGTYVESQHLRGYFGGEWALDPRLLLRAGMAQTDPTFGVGLRQNWGKSRIMVDYAFLTSPTSDDPDHVLSLGVGF